MLILASTSQTRMKLLENAGVNFRALSPDIDESALQKKFSTKSPRDLAQILADAKALSLSLKRYDDLIIGADQTLECGGNIIHKAPNSQKAKEILRDLMGKKHCLNSSISCALGGKIIWQYSDTAELTMREFSQKFLEDYVTQAEADILSSVGSYKLEGLGIQLFKKIRGDYFTILGFPLIPFLEFIRSQKLLAS